MADVALELMVGKMLPAITGRVVCMLGVTAWQVWQSVVDC